MEIERINDDTVKFFVSYLDIEERGFHREEIWYNREKSEQLFWEMMEEVNDYEDFEIEGPLWIQVQAHGKGLEFTVTRARISSNDIGGFDELGDVTSSINDKRIKSSEDSDVEEFVNNKFPEPLKASLDDSVSRATIKNDNFSIIMRFSEFEHIIQLSYSLNEIVDDLNDRLFYYKDAYYLHMEFDQNLFDADAQDDIISMILEYAEEVDISILVLAEYGKIIFENQTFSQIRAHFSND